MSNENERAPKQNGRKPKGMKMPVTPEMKKNAKRSLKRLLGYIKGKHRVMLCIVLVCLLVSSIVGVIGSMFIQTLIDDYITPLLLESAPVFTGLLRAILVMALIYGVGIVSTFLSNRLMVYISQGILKEIRDEMFEHMQKLPLRYFDTRTNGDIMSHYTNDVDTLRQMISQSIPQVCSSVVTIVAVLFAMITTSLWLTGLVVICVIIMLRVTGKIAGNSGKYFMKQQRSIGRVNGYIEEMINGQKVVKVFNHEEVAKADFDELNSELFEDAYKANMFANILMPTMAQLGNLQYVLIAIVGGALSLSGVTTLTLGAIAAFLQLSKSFVMPINQVSQQLNSVVMALAGAERIFALMDEEPEADNGDVVLVNVKYVDGELVETEEVTNIWGWKHVHSDGRITLTELKGDVRFDNVDFGYNEDKLVLKGINLFAKPGQKIALVGATGAGKTTITNLINRFYDLADGKIKYDGININKIKKRDLRHSLGIVLQDVNLFTGTVMDNIRYGRLNATDEECIEAAKLVNAHGFIMQLQDGYNTMLEGNGSGLSQGQRQLLSIARAAVANPPALILDEATSSIDTRTEKIIQDGMDGLMKGRTVFVIAHRLSTVQNADAILVLEDGQIIERGNHDELIAQKGKYYQLYTGAFELE